ncbi:NTP transferase domain-containing protein [Micromonospora sp. M12]
MRTGARGARRGCRRGARPAGAVPIRHDRWADGLGSSLLRGLASFSAEVSAAVVVLVDQPLLSPVAVRRVREAYRAGAVVAVATYAGRPGTRSCWAGRPGRCWAGTPSVTGAPVTCCATGRTWWSRCPVTTPAPRSTWTPGRPAPLPNGR